MWSERTYSVLSTIERRAFRRIDSLQNSYLCTQLGRADELGTVCSDTCGTDCSASMVPITVIHLVPIQRYQHVYEPERDSELQAHVNETHYHMTHPQLIRHQLIRVLSMSLPQVLMQHDSMEYSQSLSAILII